MSTQQLKWLKTATSEEQVAFLTILRITLESKLSAARRIVRPTKLTSELRSIHEFIETTYLTDIVIDTACANRTGEHGQPYDFWPEMLRDVSQYLLLVARLSGDFRVYQLFVKRFFAHFNEADVTADCYWLLKFEDQQVSYMLRAESGELRILHNLMDRAIAAALAIGNVERAASVALSVYFTTRGVIRESALEHYKDCVTVRPLVSDMYGKQRKKHLLLVFQLLVFSVWRRFAKLNISDLNHLIVRFE